MSWSWIILITFLLLWLIRKFILKKPDTWASQGVLKINSRDIAPLLDRIRMKIPFHKQDQMMYNRIRSVGERFAGYSEFGKSLFVVADADLVKHILVKDFDSFTNRRALNIDDDVLSEMLSNKRDQEWKSMRSLLSPTFTTGKIRRMYEIFNESGLKWVEFMKEEMSTINEINMQDMAGKYTMDVIASVAFGLDTQTFQNQDNIFTTNAKKMQTNFTGFWGILRLIMVITMPSVVKKLRIPLLNKEAVNVFLDTIRKAKEYRQNSGVTRDDFLQLLLETQAGKLEIEDPQETLDTFEKEISSVPKSKGTLTETQLLAQALLFFVAGFNTIETLLSFASYELALNPDFQERLAEEINTTMKNHGGKLTYEAVIQMEYLDMFISETLRHHPPAIRIERQSTKDYTVPDTNIIIPKGTIIAIPAYSLHHDSKYFPNPDSFNPENFSVENKRQRHPYAYLPFGAGPRNCIAMRFALIEGKTALAHLVHNFIIEPNSKTHIPMKYAKKAAMKPENGMWLHLKRRTLTVTTLSQ